MSTFDNGKILQKLEVFYARAVLLQEHLRFVPGAFHSKSRFGPHVCLAECNLSALQRE